MAGSVCVYACMCTRDTAHRGGQRTVSAVSPGLPPCLKKRSLVRCYICQAAQPTQCQGSRILLFLPFILQELQTWLLSGSRDLNSGLLDIRHLPSLASHLPKVIILDSFVSYNVCALSYRLNKPFMDYGDTVMHGLEASPNAWLQNHAHWGRYLVLPLFTMG